MKLYSTMPIKINTWDTHVCCMVCKMYILNNPYVVSNRPWEAKFRACGWSTNRLGSDVFTNIHPVHDTRDGVKLTGLGFCRQYDANEVPNDEHARWDTMGNDWSSLRDLNGYAFHDRCWNLIMEHFSPWEFDFESLYEALECLPWPEGSASLSMSYQLSLETNHSLMYIAPWIHQIRNRHNREGCDPFILPTLEQLMQPSTSFPASPQGIAKGSLYHNPTDPFNVLPLELREGIAMQLPTHDVLNLRCCSRAMVPMFSNNFFWATRFAIDGERGFLHPLVKQFFQNARNDIDWRFLYHCTCKIKCGPGFDFHIRIWESLRWLRDATLARYFKMSMPLCFAGRAVQHYHNTRYPDTHIETVDIKPSLYEMTVSAVRINESIYITGLEFLFSNQPSIFIGYKDPGAKVKIRDSNNRAPRTKESKLAELSDYTCPGLLFKTHIKRLRGFYLNRSPSGVQEIGIIQRPQSPFRVGHSDFQGDNHKYEFSLDTVSKVIVTLDVSWASCYWNNHAHDWCHETALQDTWPRDTGYNEEKIRQAKHCRLSSVLHVRIHEYNCSWMDFCFWIKCFF